MLLCSACPVFCTFLKIAPPRGFTWEKAVQRSESRSYRIVPIGLRRKRVTRSPKEGLPIWGINGSLSDTCWIWICCLMLVCMLLLLSWMKLFLWAWGGELVSFKDMGCVDWCCYCGRCGSHAWLSVCLLHLSFFCGIYCFLLLFAYLLISNPFFLLALFK